jgi:RNA polymerase sigma-70 factor, ECF subfamily
LSSITHQHIQNVLQKAKSGDQESVGELLGVYRDYLLGIAVARLDPRIRARCNPSDVVQETMLEAYRDFHQFRGGLEREFLAWIRQILANNLARMVERPWYSKRCPKTGRIATQPPPISRSI